MAMFVADRQGAGPKLRRRWCRRVAGSLLSLLAGCSSCPPAPQHRLWDCPTVAGRLDRAFGERPSPGERPGGWGLPAVAGRRLWARGTHLGEPGWAAKRLREWGARQNRAGSSRHLPWLPPGAAVAVPMAITSAGGRGAPHQAGDPTWAKHTRLAGTAASQGRPRHSASHCMHPQKASYADARPQQTRCPLLLPPLPGLLCAAPGRLRATSRGVPTHWYRQGFASCSGAVGRATAATAAAATLAALRPLLQAIPLSTPAPHRSAAAAATQPQHSSRRQRQQLDR